MKPLGRLPVFAFLVTVLPVTGQPPAAAPTRSVAGAFVRDFASDQKVIWTSPFRMSKRRWLNTALPVAVGAAVFIATDRTVANGLPNTQDQVVWSKRVSRAGAAYSLAGATAVPVLAGALTHRPKAVRVGLSGAEALADAVVVTYALKYAFNRERPDSTNGNGRFFHGGDGFPSGHAVGTWATAVAIGPDRRTPRWLAITCYTAASAVSLSRIGARRHYPSDVFVGSAFGFLIGRYVAHKNAP